MSAVLVVDDEPGIRSALELALSAAGLEVFTAATGPEAVAIYRQHRHDISVVLLDVVMPEMDGPATLEALAAINPSVRCFYSTGAHESTLRRVCNRKVAGVITKPFLLSELTGLLVSYVNAPRRPEPLDLSAIEAS